MLVGLEKPTGRYSHIKGIIKMYFLTNISMENVLDLSKPENFRNKTIPSMAEINDMIRMSNRMQNISEF